jgi:hypothetical protein
LVPEPGLEAPKPGLKGRAHRAPALKGRAYSGHDGLRQAGW